jgi:hypothetical protein
VDRRHSPQAKGRQERFFSTARDPLVKGLRKPGASTVAAANQYLQQVYLPLWQRTFFWKPGSASQPRQPLDGPLRFLLRIHPAGDSAQEGKMKSRSQAETKLRPDKNGRRLPLSPVPGPQLGNYTQENLLLCKTKPLPGAESHRPLRKRLTQPISSEPAPLHRP